MDQVYVPTERAKLIFSSAKKKKNLIYTCFIETSLWLQHEDVDSSNEKSTCPIVKVITTSSGTV